MVQLKFLDFSQRVNFKLLELLLPLDVEVLEHIIANLDIFFHLSALDVKSQLVLVGDDLLLEESHLLHEVFVQLVLVNLGALLCQQLHLFFGALEDHDLLVFIKHAITTSIEDLQKLKGAPKSQ